MITGLIAFWFFSTALSAATVVVARRIGRCQRDTVALGSVSNDLARAIAGMVSRGIDRGLLPALKDSLADVDIQLREHQDSYRTLLDLLNHLTATFSDRRDTPAELPAIIKAIFQLQATLEISHADLAACLTIIDSRLRSDGTASKRVHRIEIPLRGALLDTRTMIALNSGTHVRQPLGVIMLDADGQTISKAKVVCG